MHEVYDQSLMLIVRKKLNITNRLFLHLSNNCKINYLLIGCLLLFAHSSQAVSLIVNDSVVFPPTSKQNIRNIFTLQKTSWPDGTRIYIFVLPDDNPVHQAFSKTLTGIFPHQYRRIWDRYTFSGTGISPTVVDSEAEMLDKISQTKNSIGYIEGEINRPDIKIIHLDFSQGVTDE